jgi:hypothetical protein
LNHWPPRMWHEDCSSQGVDSKGVVEKMSEYKSPMEKLEERVACLENFIDIFLVFMRATNESLLELLNKLNVHIEKGEEEPPREVKA